METNYTLVGSQQDLEKVSLLLKQEETFYKLPFKQVSANAIANLEHTGIILIANRRTIGTACKTLEYIQQVNLKIPVVVVSELKDADLLYYSLKVNLVDFIIDCGSQLLLKENLLKARTILINSSNRKRVLAIGAHPDDIEIGCGGALLKHKKQKHDITILTLTQGSVGGNKTQRINESKSAADYLNARLLIHDLEDTKLSEGNPTIDVIQNAITIAKPDIIYTHSYNDNHQDHRATNQATLVAARNVAKVFAYLAPSTNVSFLPRHFEVVDHFIEEKQKLINFHVSQTTDKARPYLKPEVIESTAVYWGRFSNYLKSEPFEVIKS